MAAYERGKLSVIAGPMFAGKTSELLKRLLFLVHSDEKILVLKPIVDDRYNEPDQLVTHNKLKHEAVSVKDFERVKDHYTIKRYNYHTIFIDEVQFFNKGETLWFVEEGLRDGVNFVIAGLDQDSRGIPFDTTARLLGLADSVTKIRAVCNICGQKATKTQRLVKTPNRIEVGGAEIYEPRCHLHWKSK
jgi:thymidine kinase|tara:strand:- start:687 stop:1253 length:567 start_codon:yes stop_codon:yes gene_type:complete